MENKPNQNRRDFITKTTLATAGISVGVKAFSSAINSRNFAGANDKIRMGFIGIGNRGSQLLELFMKNDDVEIAALCDVYEPYLLRDRSKVDSRYLADRNGQVPKMGEKFTKPPKIFSDYRNLLEDKDIDAVFVCCSSGTSTIGLAQGYNKIAGHIPQIHIVQTTKICPIASQFDKNYEKAINSIANAVSDKIAKRKENVLDIVKSSNGFGWVVSDQEIIEAKKELVKLGIKVEGYNAYVSYAGYKKSVKQRGIYKNPVCIISGV